jgi:hypothetical protein
MWVPLLAPVVEGVQVSVVQEVAQCLPCTVTVISPPLPNVLTHSISLADFAVEVAQHDNGAPVLEVQDVGLELCVRSLDGSSGLQGGWWQVDKANKHRWDTPAAAVHL